jgi:hypothetical protein
MVRDRGSKGMDGCPLTDAPRLEGDCIGLEWGDGRGFAQLLYHLQCIYEVLLVYLPLDMQSGCDYSVGVCYSPAGSDKIHIVDFSMHQCAFTCVCPSHQLCGCSCGSVTVGHNPLDEVILFIQCHIVDVMVEVALSANVASLATAVAGLHNGFEGPGGVDVHGNARRECTQRGMHCCRGHGSGDVCAEE